MNYPSKTFLKIGVSLGTAVFLFFALFAALNANVLAAPNSPQAPLANNIRISQVYGGGGGSTGYYLNDYVELFNAGSGSVSLDGWSLQYGSATGNFASSATNLYAFPSNTSIAPGQYLLVQFGSTGSGGLALPITPDIITTNLNMSGASGKVALANIATALGCGITASPCALPHISIVDLVAYGASNNAEGGVSVNNGVALTSQQGSVRKLLGCQDTDVNNDDFEVLTGVMLQPRNTNSPTHSCASPELTISKSVEPVTAVPYQSAVTYTVVLENSTAVDETAVLFTDTLPASTTFVGWVEQPTDASETGGEITWTGTVTASESVTFTFTANQTADYGETITNTAEFSGTIAGTAKAAFTVEDEPLLVDLNVQKTGPGYGVAGEPINYTVVISNDGSLLAENVMFTDTFPAEISYVSDDNAASPTTPSANVYVWDLGSLASGTAVTINLTGTITDSITTTTLVTNTAEVSTSTIGDNTANNSAKFETTLTPFVTIHDIQFTTDASGDSPYKNQTVTTEGIVTANFGKQVFIQEGAGAWNGVMLYQPSGSLAIGDYVRVTGKVIEYYNLTEFSSGAQTTVISTSNSLPAFEVLPTGDVSTEPYESVLVQVNNVNVSNEELGFGEWAVNDGSGDVVVNDLGSYTYVPTNNDQLYFVRGPLNYDYSVFKIEPRNDGDIAQGISIEKAAPNLVAPGGLFTYTISVKNQIGFDLTNVVISDVIPANTTFAYALNSGTESSGIVSWNIASLPHDSGVSVQFAVTATNSITAVVNDLFSVTASNHITPVTGLQTTTYIDEKLHIYQVQGAGFTSPIVGSNVTVSGEVVADFQGSSGMKGFFLQDQTGDGNVLTSDGIFVYDNTFGVAVNMGDVVTVTGEVIEFEGMTEIGSVTAVITQTGSPSIPATLVTLPETVNGDLERYEGMWITLPQTMTVAQNYFQGQYGQVNLSSNGRLFQPTNVYTPTNPEATTLADSNARNYLTLDDGRTSSNPEPTPYISPVDNTLRAGDITSGLMGVLDEGIISSGSEPTIDYRLQPLDPTAISFTRVNERTNAPEDVGGRLQIASFNVLNYFTTLGSGYNCGPDLDLQCRGAGNETEFVRQRTKIITALVSINADVVGLMEIENNETAAITDLVAGLNEEAGADTYAFIDTGYIGTDAIKVAMIYQPANVTPVGTTAVLTDVFPFDTNTRPPLAQAFVENETGHEFIVVVNHFKSKGSACTDDPNLGDGQGECNLTRVQAANELSAWLKTDPTGTGDPDIFIIGDLNSYAQEDPITALKGHGYTNLIEQFTGTWAYSYVFDGQLGYLDHALASSSAQDSVTGVTEWHINADEPSALDYNDYNWAPLYNGDAFRASDHDPVLIGVSLKWITYFPLMFK